MQAVTPQPAPPDTSFVDDACHHETESLQPMLSPWIRATDLRPTGMEFEISSNIRTKELTARRRGSQRGHHSRAVKKMKVLASSHGSRHDPTRRASAAPKDPWGYGDQKGLRKAQWVSLHALGLCPLKVLDNQHAWWARLAVMWRFQVGLLPPFHQQRNPLLSGSSSCHLEDEQDYM